MINFYRAQIDFQTIFDHVNQYFDLYLKDRNGQNIDP